MVAFTSFDSETLNSHSIYAQKLRESSFIFKVKKRFLEPQIFIFRLSPLISLTSEAA